MNIPTKCFADERDFFVITFRRATIKSTLVYQGRCGVAPRCPKLLNESRFTKTRT